MLKLITKEYIYIFLFFFSLLFLDNDINSKVVFILVIFSLFRFKGNYFKALIIKHYPLIFLFLLIIFSLIYSTNISSGIKYTLRLAIIPASVVIFTSFYQQQKKIASLYIFVILIAVCYSHFKITLLFIENNESHFRNFFNLNYSYQALGNTINLHPTYYSIYILMAVIFLLDFIKRKSGKKSSKIICLFLFIYFSFFIVQLSSRISIIILYIITILNIINYSYTSKKLLKGLITLIIFHIIAFVFIMNISTTKYRFQHLFGFTYYTGYTVNDTNHKAKLWSAAINANNNILFGNGIGDIQHSLNKQYIEKNLKTPLKKTYNSHNQYIEYYVGLGLLGFITLVYLYLYYFYVFIKNNNFIGLQFIILISIASITECIWNRHNGIVFIVFWLFYLNNNHSISSKPSFLINLKDAKTINENKNLV